MTVYWLKFTLLSDATFGRGDGIAGFLDTEVQHDDFGLPYLTGRALRGLLNYECADILFALGLQGKKETWASTAQYLFGSPGSHGDDMSRLRIGDACLPQLLRRAVEIGVKRKELRREEVLASLTAIRRQTAIDEITGAPAENSLRAERVILRGTPFEAELCFTEAPTPAALALLAACVKALRRAGTGRNRGRGQLAACLWDAQGNDVTKPHFDYFVQEAQR
jgi:hypothetical protein